MQLANRLSEYVRACFTGIWIESSEHEDALTEIATLCRDQQWQLATWDIETGLNIPGQTDSDAGSSDPLGTIPPAASRSLFRERTSGVGKGPSRFLPHPEISRPNSPNL